MRVTSDFFAISGYINFLTTFCLGIFILIKSHQIKANRYFAYFCFAAAVWSFFYAVVFTVKDPIMKEYYLTISMIGSFFCPTTFLHFTKHFLRRNISSWFIAFNYGFGVLAIPFAFSRLYAHGMSPFLDVMWGNRGPMFDITFLQFMAVLFYAFWCLFDSFRKEPDPFIKKQIRQILIALLIGFVSGSTNFFFWYKIPIPPVTNVFVSVYVIMVTYAILKYQLLDIQITIKNSLVYSVLVFGISMIYFAMIYVSGQYFKGVVGYQSLFSTLITAFIVAVFFIPFKDFIQSLVEKNIFKATYAQIADQNENLRRQIMLSERYRTFAEVAQSIAAAIRNPLTVVKTYNYYLEKKLNEPGFLQKYLKTTSVEIERMEKMIDELSKYSSPDPLIIDQVDICNLLDEVLENISLQLNTQQIRVVKNYHQNQMLRLRADAKQLHQTFVNIICHELRTMPKESHLMITTTEKPGVLEIVIKDDGQVIPKDQLEKIFDPFYRYGEPGHGLELGIAFAIIESHGGKITVNSSLKSGNEFIIQMPLKES